MPISPGAEPHMVALANQADAANRPRWIIIFSLGITIVCAVIAMIGVSRLLAARAGYASAEGQLRQADALSAQIVSLRTARPSNAELYPPAGLMYNHVERALTDTWGVDKNSFSTFATLELSNPEALSIPGLNKVNVKCTIRNQPLDKILQFIEATLTKEEMANAFVSAFELEPSPGGWNALIEFRRYAVR